MSHLPLLLLKYLNALKHRRIKPGEHDCAQMAGGWVGVVTGDHPGAAFRGGYRSLAQGRKLLREVGFDTLGDLAASHLYEVPATDLRLGDIAILTDQDQEHFGIVGGPHIHVLAPEGLDIVPLSRAVRVFRP